MSTIHRPNHTCRNATCGSTYYTADRDWLNDGEGMKSVWRCVNCGNVTPRQERNRRTNARRASDLWAGLREDWKETNDALDLICELGQPNGCLLVHSSTFNYHMDALLGLKGKLSNFDVRYHASEARKDLGRAKEFVSKYCKVAYA